jgi:hypothetical protein
MECVTGGRARRMAALSHGRVNAVRSRGKRRDGLWKGVRTRDRGHRDRVRAHHDLTDGTGGGIVGRGRRAGSDGGRVQRWRLPARNAGGLVAFSRGRVHGGKRHLRQHCREDRSGNPAPPAALGLVTRRHRRQPQVSTQRTTYDIGIHGSQIELPISSDPRAPFLMWLQRSPRYVPSQRRAPVGHHGTRGDWRVDLGAPWRQARVRE